MNSMLLLSGGRINVYVTHGNFIHKGEMNFHPFPLINGIFLSWNGPFSYLIHHTNFF